MKSLGGFTLTMPSDRPLPPPLVELTEVEPDDDRVPRAARALARKAEANGWQVRITYACGAVASRRPADAERGYRWVDSIAVRMRKYARCTCDSHKTEAPGMAPMFHEGRITACYIDGKFDCAVSPAGRSWGARALNEEIERAWT